VLWAAENILHGVQELEVETVAMMLTKLLAQAACEVA
jgi:hypothetical protein